MSDRAEMFTARLEEVYTKYKPAVRSEIVTWASKLSAPALKAVYTKVRENFSNQYNKAPDVANLVAAYKEYQKEMADEWMYKALPDPEFEDRARTMTEEEIAEGQQYIQKLLRGMQVGKHPQEVYKEWQEEQE